MHKKDLENLQEHSERIIKNYEVEMQNIRDKLAKTKSERDKYSGELEILKNHRIKMTSDLQEAHTEINKLKCKIMKMENIHNEEIRDYKEKLHKQDSEMKEFIMDDEFSKSEIMKEIKKAKNKYESQLDMARTEYELQMDILKKDLERKEREVNRYKNEVENMNEIVNEKEMTYEIKRHKDYQVIEKLQEQVHELKIQNQTLLSEKKGVEKENRLLQMKYDDEVAAKAQAEEMYSDKLLVNKLNRKIAGLEQDKEDLELQVKELTEKNNELFNKSKNKQSLNFSLRESDEISSLKRSLRAVEKYNNDLKDQLKRVTGLLSKDQYKENQAQNLISFGDEPKHEVKCNNFRPAPSSQFNSFTNTLATNSHALEKTTPLYSYSYVSKTPQNYYEVNESRSLRGNSIKSKILKLKETVNSDFGL